MASSGIRASGHLPLRSSDLEHFYRPFAFGVGHDSFLDDLECSKVDQTLIKRKAESANCDFTFGK